VEFGGEDPRKPVLHEVLEKSKQELEELQAALASGRHVLVLPEPTGDGRDRRRTRPTQGTRAPAQLGPVLFRI
jgi:hypothetical protein